MKTVQFLGESAVRVVDAPEPEPDEGYAVVKVMASSICGTERHAFEDGFGEGVRRMNGGHEATGIVWKTSPDSTLRHGSRVNLYAMPGHCGVCRYCVSGRWVLCRNDQTAAAGSGFHSQFVRIREDFCLPLPDDIDFATGALFTDVLGTSYHAIRRLNISAVDTVLVTGQGPIGLATTMICDYFGARVIAVDTNDLRLTVARQCGAAATLNPTSDDVLDRVREIAGADGVDAAIDCAGAQVTRLSCLQAVRRGGRVAFVGLSDDGLTLDGPQYMQHFFLKDLQLIASWYSDPADLLELAELVRRGLNPRRMVTHEFPIDRASEAYATMFGGSGAKVVIYPWADAPSIETVDA